MIWVNLFDACEQDQAIINFRLMIQESQKLNISVTEYFGKVHHTNGTVSKLNFIHQNLDKLKTLIDYILGFLPELEKQLDPQLLLRAEQHSKQMIAEIMTANHQLPKENN